MVYHSKKISQFATDQFHIEGELTIKDQTHPVSLSAKINKAGVNPHTKAPTLGLSITSDLKRSVWGMGYAVPAVSDKIDIKIEVELFQETQEVSEKKSKKK